MKKILTLLMAAVVFVSSCKKADPPTNTELLAKAWKHSSFKASTSSVTIDLLMEMDACERDNILRFKTDKTYTEEEGPIKCSPNASQIVDNGVWSFSADEKSLILDGETLSIVELSSSKLHVKYVEQGSQPVTVDLILVPSN